MAVRNAPIERMTVPAGGQVRTLSSHNAEPARVPLSSRARRAVSVPSSRSRGQRLWRVLTGLSLVIVLVAVLVSAVLAIIGLIG
jgi:hypothetical protein